MRLTAIRLGLIFFGVCTLAEEPTAIWKVGNTSGYWTSASNWTDKDGVTLAAPTTRTITFADEL